MSKKIRDTTSRLRARAGWSNVLIGESNVAIVPAIGGYGVEDIYLGEFSPQRSSVLFRPGGPRAALPHCLVGAPISALAGWNVKHLPSVYFSLRVRKPDSVSSRVRVLAHQPETGPNPLREPFIINWFTLASVDTQCIDSSLESG